LQQLLHRMFQVDTINPPSAAHRRQER